MNFLHVCFAIFAFGLVYVNSDEGLFESRIIGGYEVQNRSNFSYQVSIRGNKSHFCGGVLYDNRHVLTAAHCVADVKNLSQLTVVLGDLNVAKPDKYTVNATVLLIKVHEKYNKTSFQNDIAMITLKETLALGKNISAIPIWEKVHPANKTLCTVSGWGYTTASGSPSNTLRAADVQFISNSTCKSIYGNIYYSGMICAGVKGKDACSGDSGGPLVCNKQLLGLVSWGIGCAQEKYPGVYVDISSYVTWIKNSVFRI